MAAVGTQGPALGNTGEKHAVGSPLRCAHVQTAHERLRWRLLGDFGLPVNRTTPAKNASVERQLFWHLKVSFLEVLRAGRSSPGLERLAPNSCSISLTGHRRVGLGGLEPANSRRTTKSPIAAVQ